MKLDFDPSLIHRRGFYNRIKAPIDVEISNITNHALTLKYHLEITEDSPEKIELQITEENKHKSTVQIFGSTKVCSCEEYYKKECGCCKHIGLISYLLESGVLTKEEKIFSKELKKSIAKFRLSKTNTYKTYCSLNDDFLLFGNGSNIIESVSTVTYNKHPKFKEQKITPVKIHSPYVVSNFATLYDYQHEILEKMLSSKRAICSMIMGAGKTLTAIAGMKELQTQNILIVCPKSIMSQWKREIQTHLGLDAVILNPKNILTNSKIGICTYQTLSRNIHLFEKKEYKLIVADEIQYIRNNESKTWSSFKRLNSEYFWGLSGTVIENRLDDLYNIMEVIAPGLCGCKWKFEARYKVIKSLNRTKVLYENQIQNKKDIHELLKNYVFSYDNLKLPNINHIEHWVKLDSLSKRNHDSYKNQADMLISKSLTSQITHAERLMIQAYLLKCRQCCDTMELITGNASQSAKIDTFLKIVDDICIKNNKKLVVYSEWTTMLDILSRELNGSIKYTRLDGSMTPNKRLQVIEYFKTDSNCKIFFSSDAGGLGIDGLQTVSNDILHIELPWNPAKLDQRNGRLHRILQKNDVNVHYLITEDTIEENIFDLLQNKRNVRKEVLYEM